jgi:hypothetical protein
MCTFPTFFDMYTELCKYCQPCRVFHHIVKTVTLDHIVTAMMLDHSVATVTLDIIVAFDIPLIALLTSLLVM